MPFCYTFPQALLSLAPSFPSLLLRQKKFFFFSPKLACGTKRVEVRRGRRGGGQFRLRKVPTHPPNTPTSEHGGSVCLFSPSFKIGRQGDSRSLAVKRERGREKSGQIWPHLGAAAKVKDCRWGNRRPSDRRRRRRRRRWSPKEGEEDAREGMKKNRPLHLVRDSP